MSAAAQRAGPLQRQAHTIRPNRGLCSVPSRGRRGGRPQVLEVPMKFSSALLAASALIVAAAPASAHFNLKYPPSATMQNGLGDPQKTGPCPTGTRTGVVTPLKAGETITLRWQETVGH